MRPSSRSRTRRSLMWRRGSRWRDRDQGSGISLTPSRFYTHERISLVPIPNHLSLQLQPDSDPLFAVI
jgi:hypothetical protein